MEEDVRRKGREKKIEIRIGIGEKSRIRRAIVDKNARIGKNVMVTITNINVQTNLFVGYDLNSAIKKKKHMN